MKTYLEERLNELRKRYKDTGEAKWRHKFDECKAIYEHYTLEQTNRTQAARPVQGRVYDPFSPFNQSSPNNDR